MKRDPDKKCRDDRIMVDTSSAPWRGGLMLVARVETMNGCP
jgi:hypothetical protein